MIGMKRLIETFDEWVKIEKGPVNSAIIDLVRGKVFQVPNHIVTNFRPDDFRDIGEFMKNVQQERQVIDINAFRRFQEKKPNEKMEPLTQEIQLHIEEGANLKSILDGFWLYPVTGIYFYGPELPPLLQNNKLATRKDKDFRECQKRSRVDGHFHPVEEKEIRFNKQYNSCWGTSIAFTADGSVRPCIHTARSSSTIKRRSPWKASTPFSSKCDPTGP